MIAKMELLEDEMGDRGIRTGLGMAVFIWNSEFQWGRDGEGRYEP